MVPAATARDVHKCRAGPNAGHAHATSSDSSCAAHDNVRAAPVLVPDTSVKSDAGHASAASGGTERGNSRGESAPARVVPDADAATNGVSSASHDVPIAADAPRHQLNDVVARDDHNERAAPKDDAVNTDANDVSDDASTSPADAHVVPCGVTAIVATPTGVPPNADGDLVPDAPDRDQHDAVVDVTSSPDDVVSNIINDDASDDASTAVCLPFPDASDDPVQSGAASILGADTDKNHPLCCRFELNVGLFFFKSKKLRKSHPCRITKPLLSALTFAMRNSRVLVKFGHSRMALRVCAKFESFAKALVLDSFAFRDSSRSRAFHTLPTIVRTAPLVVFKDSHTRRKGSSKRF